MPSAPSPPELRPAAELASAMAKQLRVPVKAQAQEPAKGEPPAVPAQIRAQAQVQAEEPQPVLATVRAWDLPLELGSEPVQLPRPAARQRSSVQSQVSPRTAPLLE